MNKQLNSHLIYALTDPRSGDIRYIGKAVRGLSRARSHWSEAVLRRDGSYCGKWIRSLLALGLTPGITVVERVDDPCALSDRERWWIAFARAWGCPLTNLTDGGDGTPGHRHTEEAKRKMSVSKRGRRLTPEVLLRRLERNAGVRAPFYGRHHTPETRAVLSAARKGKKQSPEVIARRSAAMRGKPLSEEHRRNIGLAGQGNKRWLGKRHTPETRAKMSAAVTPEERARRAARLAERNRQRARANRRES